MDDSPQGTWKRVRPVLLTTLVPVVAALGFFALATYAKKTPDPKNLPSMAAFDACLSANDLQPAQSYASQFDAQIASEQEMKVCGDKVPKDVIKKWQQQAEAQVQSERTAYRNCVEGLAGSPSRGFGRFHGGSSGFRNFRNAMSTCRSLIQGGTGGSTPAPKPSTKSPGPIA